MSTTAEADKAQDLQARVWFSAHDVQGLDALGSQFAANSVDNPIRKSCHVPVCECLSRRVGGLFVLARLLGLDGDGRRQCRSIRVAAAAAAAASQQAGRDRERERANAQTGEFFAEI